MLFVQKASGQRPLCVNASAALLKTHEGKPTGQQGESQEPVGSSESPAHDCDQESERDQSQKRQDPDDEREAPGILGQVLPNEVAVEVH